MTRWLCALPYEAYSIDFKDSSGICTYSNTSHSIYSNALTQLKAITPRCQHINLLWAAEMSMLSTDWKKQSIEYSKHMQHWFSTKLLETVFIIRALEVSPLKCFNVIATCFSILSIHPLKKMFITNIYCPLRPISSPSELHSGQLWKSAFLCRIIGDESN